MKVVPGWLRIACAAFVWGATFTSGSARAEETADAIVSRGIELRRAGRDREALSEFQRAFRIQKTPRIQAQIAVAQQALGMWAAAEADLLVALADENDPWIVKNRPTLAKALKNIQARLASLEVWGTPAGAQIFVNERAVGTLPLAAPLRLTEDSVILRARAEGYSAINRTVRIQIGGTVREHVELVPLAAPRASSPIPAVGAGAVATQMVAKPTGVSSSSAAPVDEAKDPSFSKDSDSPADTGAASSSRLRPYAWIAAAGAAGSLVFAAIQTATALKKKREFEDHTGPDPGGTTARVPDCFTAMLTAACRPLHEAHNKAVTLSIVGYAVGGALAFGSVILFVLSSGNQGAGEKTVACAPDVFNSGIACQLRF